MKLKILFLLLILFLVEVKLYGQVTVTIESVLVNNLTTVTNCNTIDFGTVTTNSLNFSFKLTKPLNQVVGNGPIKIMFKYSSASTGNQRNSITILSGSWNDDTFNNISTYQSSIQTNISASEIQVSGSSVYLQYTSSSGINYDSTCEYPLTKTLPPSFTLSPTSVSLSCGDTSSRTFTVTPANIPSGATVTYQWSYTGWSLISSTATSITLQPISGTNLPSNVSVTPSINSVAQTSKTSAVSRAPFSTSATIVGSNVVCSTTGTYTINNLPSNASIQSVSSSNSNIATATLDSNGEITLAKVSNGSVTLSVILQNTCSQTTIKTKNIHLGKPGTPASLIGPSTVNTGALVSYQAGVSNGATSYTWYLPYPYTTVSSFNYFGQNWQLLAPGNSSSAQAFTGYAKNAGYVQAMGTNDCGKGGAKLLYVQHGSGGGGGIPRIGQTDDVEEVILYPNPAKNKVTVSLTQLTEYEGEPPTVIYGIKIMDLKLVERRYYQFKKFKNQEEINVAFLPTGLYSLIVYTDTATFTKKLLVD